MSEKMYPTVARVYPESDEFFLSFLSCFSVLQHSTPKLVGKNYNICEISIVIETYASLSNVMLIFTSNFLVSKTNKKAKNSYKARVR